LIIPSNVCDLNSNLNSFKYQLINSKFKLKWNKFKNNHQDVVLPDEKRIEEEEKHNKLRGNKINNLNKLRKKNNKIPLNNLRSRKR
jgi:hypothetical protein